MNNYLEYKFYIDEDVKPKLKILEMPYYINLLFFISETYQSGIDSKKRIFKGELNRTTQIETHIFDNSKTFTNENKKINNNYINNINININNNSSSIITQNDMENNLLNHIKIAISGENSKQAKPIVNLNTGNILNKNLNSLIKESKIF